MGFGNYSEKTRKTLDREALEEMLPQSGPFLLPDSVYLLDTGHVAIGVMEVQGDREYT